MKPSVFNFVAAQVVPGLDIELGADLVEQLASSLLDQDLLVETYQEAAELGLEWCGTCHELVQVETQQDPTRPGFECPVCGGQTNNVTHLLVR